MLPYIHVTFKISAAPAFKQMLINFIFTVGIVKNKFCFCYNKDQRKDIGLNLGRSQNIYLYNYVIFEKEDAKKENEKNP